MKLEDFLFLIQDEEARIELEIYEDNEEGYQYNHFWLSDFVQILMLPNITEITM